MYAMSSQSERLIEKILNDLTSDIRAVREDIAHIKEQKSDIESTVDDHEKRLNHIEPRVKELTKREGKTINISSISAKTIWGLVSAVLITLTILASTLGVNISWLIS